MAHLVCEVRFTRALPARHLPSSGFGYPRDGLLPRGPSRPCFMPAAPMGFSLRSVLLGRDFPASSAGSRPACRYRKPTLDQTEVWSSWRLATRLPGTSSAESLAALCGHLARNAAGCSPGLSPFQGISRWPWRTFQVHLLPALDRRNGYPHRRCRASESRSTIA